MTQDNAARPPITESAGLLKNPGSEALSSRELQDIRRYTRAMRKTSGKVFTKETFRSKLRRRIEGINRRMFYQILRIFFRNPEPHERLSPDEVRSIFVIPFGGAIGDMLVAIPLFHAIKRHLPHCKVGTFVTERNRSLLRSDPNVDEVFAIRNKRSFKNIRETLRARKSGYDVVINMHIHGMTEYGLIANAISPRGTKVSWTHARGRLYRTLYNKLIPYERDSMQGAQMGLVMLESVIDLERPIEQWESRPVVNVSDQTRQVTEARIKESLSGLGAAWYIQCNLQARNPDREWGLENSMEFARRFVDHYPDAAVLFSASPFLRDALEQRVGELNIPRAVFFPTSYDLQEVAVLVDNARLVITPDTATTHFASAGNKPVLILHPGLIKLPLEWIALQVPSFNLAPPKRTMKASEITVDEVWEATRRLLEGEWTSTASSVGLEPDADILFQSANKQVALELLIQSSSVPRLFPPGSRHSVPLSLMRKLDPVEPIFPAK